MACDAGQQSDKGTGFHNRNGVLLVSKDGRMIMGIKDSLWTMALLLLEIPKSYYGNYSVYSTMRFFVWNHAHSTSEGLD